MKKKLYSLVFCLIMSNVSSVRACGNLSAFFASPEAQAAFTYVMIEGQEYFKSVVKTTIKSLILLHDEHPEVFMIYINYCLSTVQGTFSDQVIGILKKFNLIQSDATISSTIQTIVSMVIEKLDSGDVKVWSLDELIKDNWVTVS